MQFKRTVLSILVTAAFLSLTACGGGGGGGSPNPLVRPDTNVPAPTPTPTVPDSNTTPSVLNPVPFYTPQKVGTVQPLTGATGTNYATSEMFVENISGGVGQDIIIAGRMTPTNNTADWRNYNLSMFGWSNGQLVDKTSQWFSGTDNQITGTEPSVKFGDFNNDGKLDMYVAPNSDTSIYGPGAVFMNTGSRFVRNNLNLGNIHGHDSAIYDINRDGKLDIFTLNFNPSSTISFGNGDGTFNTITNITGVGGGAGVAVADFLGNGTATFIITDAGAGGNRLYNWSVTSQLGYPNLYINEIAVLPTPRFLLPKWASYGFTGTHDVRALAVDFDNSGRIGVVIMSRPWVTNGSWPGYSEVQFLKNQGNGIFVDVTDNTLVGYDHGVVPVSYNPKLMDVNNDGLIDIVLGGGNNAAILVHTAEHKYVTSYATVLKAFQDQSANIEQVQHAIERGDNNIVFLQGPDGTMYLATTITYYNNNQIYKSVYLSKLGDSAVSAQATATSIRQTWPWMSDAQVNTVLAQSSTTWFGLNVLDPAKALQPIGPLGIMVNDRITSLQGYISGINLNGQANQIKVLDSIGRDFNINYSSTSLVGTNMFGRFTENIDDDTRGAQLTGLQALRYNGWKFAGSNDNRNMLIGITGISLTEDTMLSAQYTRTSHSPFVQLNGSWGMVKNSSTFESTVTYKNNQFVSKVGLLYSTTEIEKGLVQRINPITSAWAETGYEWTNFKMYGGILPTVLSGSADLTLPTGVDNRGRISYTNTRADVYSPTVTYARFSYSDRINKRVLYRVNGIVTSQQQHSIVGDMQISF
jgi:predicted small lipoprotein YifL